MSRHAPPSWVGRDGGGPSFITHTILFADLTDRDPQFVPISLDQLPHQSQFVAPIIR